MAVFMNKIIKSFMRKLRSSSSFLDHDPSATAFSPPHIQPDLLISHLSSYSKSPHLHPTTLPHKYNHLFQFHGLLPDIVTCNTVLHGLCAHQHLLSSTPIPSSSSSSSSSSFMEEMERRGVRPDTVTYSILMDSAFKRGNSSQAKKLHGQMVKRGIPLDTVAFTILIDGLFKAGEGAEALKIFNSLKKKKKKKRGSGVEEVVSNGVTQACVINGLCLLGETKAAEKATEHITDPHPHTKLVAYSTLVNAYSREGIFHKAVKILRNMEEDSSLIRLLNSFSFSSLIRHLGRWGREVEALQMYHHMTSKQIKTQDSFALNEAINILKKSWRIREAYPIVESSTIHPDIFVYTSLMHGFFREGDEEAALRTAITIQERGLRFDIVSHNVLLTGLLNSKNGYNPSSVYQQMKEMGMVPNQSSYTSMFRAYFNRRDGISPAYNLWEEMRSQGVEPSMSSCELFVKGLCGEHQVERALQFLQQVSSLFPPSEASHREVLHWLVRGGRGEMLVSSHEALVRMGLKTTLSVYNTLVGSLCRVGMVKSAVEITEKMKEERVGGDVATYNGLIHGYLRRNQVGRAMEVYEKMGEDVNGVTFRVMVGGLFKLKLLERGREWMREEMEKKRGGGFRVDGGIYDLMVRGYGEAGDERGLMEVYCEMVGRGYVPLVLTYNVMIMCFVKRGKVREGLELLKEIKLRGRRPRGSTYGLLIRGLCFERRRIGWWRDGVKKLLKAMLEEGLRPTPWTVKCLTRAFARPAMRADADRFFHEMYPFLSTK